MFLNYLQRIVKTSHQNKKIIYYEAWTQKFQLLIDVLELSCEIAGRIIMV